MFQPVGRGQDEGEADTQDDPRGRCLARQKGYQAIQGKGHEERGSRYEALYTASHVLPAHHLGIQIDGLVVVHRQLKQEEVDGARHEKHLSLIHI